MQGAGDRRGPPQRSPAFRRLVDQSHDSLGHRADVKAALADDPFELLVDLAGDESQRQVAQGGQVGLGEELLERHRGTFGRIDVAVAHPLPERVRAHVHQLDLVGGPDHLVWDSLADRHVQDRLDRVGDRLDVLDVAGADDLDAGVPDQLDVLPALLPRGARDVVVGELVDKGDGGVAGDDRVGVHLLHGDAAVLDALPRHDLQAVQESGGVAPAVGLYEADHDVGAPVVAAMGLLEHLVGLADAGGHAHVDPQTAALRLLLCLEPGEHLIAGWAGGIRGFGRHFSSPSRSRLSSSTWTPAEPMKPRNGPEVWRATTARTASSVMPRALATRAT